MTDPTIQAPAGPPAAAKGSWLVSLAEIDAMGRKAAQGAGFSWGMAEEAGRAARWLAAYGLPGPEALAAVLQKTDHAVSRHAPDPDWRSQAGRLCPVAAGTALSDRAQEIARGTRFDLGPVIMPLFVVPFLARAARDLDCLIAVNVNVNVNVTGGGVEVGAATVVVATPQGPACEGWDSLCAAPEASLSVTLAEAPPCEPRRAGTGARPVEVALWRTFDSFAQRTYVPASEASRRAGAGAGLHDYD